MHWYFNPVFILFMTISFLVNIFFAKNQFIKAPIPGSIDGTWYGHGFKDVYDLRKDSSGQVADTGLTWLLQDTRERVENVSLNLYGGNFHLTIDGELIDGLYQYSHSDSHLNLIPYGTSEYEIFHDFTVESFYLDDLEDYNIPPKGLEIAEEVITPYYDSVVFRFNLYDHSSGPGEVESYYTLTLGKGSEL